MEFIEQDGDIVYKKEVNEQNIKMTKYAISQHAAERYAERALGYTTKTDQVKYANLRSTEIREFINKLCSYGECIFEGKIRNHNHTKIYKNKNWIIVVDPNNNKVVTCYPLQFGVGEDFDIEYTNRLAKALEELVVKKVEIEDEINSFKDNYLNNIKSNNKKIDEYKGIINQLLEQNKSYQSIVDSVDVDVKTAELDIYNLIDKMTGKKVI